MIRLIVIPPLWIITSSILYLFAVDRLYLFSFPTDIWLWITLIIEWNRVILWPDKICLVGSSVVSTLMYGAIILLMFRRTNSAFPILYGNSQWASNKELQQGGIKRSKSPFK